MDSPCASNFSGGSEGKWAFLCMSVQVMGFHIMGDFLKAMKLILVPLISLSKEVVGKEKQSKTNEQGTLINGLLRN